jgi:hypothetical protein
MQNRTSRLSPWRAYRRDALIIGLLALGVGLIMAALIRNPGYTDAYYYFNAGQRLVQGKGLTDAALWTYIGTPAGLPVPSHLYWMPLTSLVAAAGMVIGGPTFDAAQTLFVPLYAGMVVIGFGLGALIGKSRRAAWLAGLLTLFSGFFMPYWTTTATFAPFGVTGSLCLLAIGLGWQTERWRWFAAAGALAALAHLTRADGLLLLMVLVIVALWPGFPARQRWQSVIVGVLAYLVVMMPWFVRSLNAVGSPLPSGGLETAWMRSYDEIANYPPTIDLGQFLAWGAGNILASRWEAFVTNLQRFVAEEGIVVLAPLMLIGLWRRRQNPLLSGFWLYAPGLHLAMTLVFAFPGPRGGLFHSAAALLPFWAALGALGLDDVIDWLARRRRWRPGEARLFFGTALVLWAAFLSLSAFAGKMNEWNAAGENFRRLNLPQDAVVMINDPSAFYYYTGIASVVLPNAAPGVILDLAGRYGVNYVVLDANRTAPMNDLWEARNVPPFLEPYYYDGHVRIYKVRDSQEFTSP